MDNFRQKVGALSNRLRYVKAIWAYTERKVQNEQKKMQATTAR